MHEALPIQSIAGNNNGVAWGDYFRTGTPTLTVARWASAPDEGPNNLFLLPSNVTRNGWLHVSLEGVASNRSGIGAKVRIKTVIDGIGMRQLRELSAQTGGNSQNALEALFGLGPAERVDSLWIEWPSGQVDLLTHLESDQRLAIREGMAPVSSEPTSGIPSTFALRPAFPNPFNPQTILTLDLSAAQYVTVYVYDVLGRQIARLHDGTLPGGGHTLTFDASDLPSGVYVVRAVGARQVESQRATLVR